MEKLVELMARLRNPNGGCPWDLEQTPESLAKYIIEETYETTEAIEDGDPKNVCEELGDLLLQIVFQARIFEERGQFKIDDVVRGIVEKMERRHPHIFGDVTANTPEDVTRNWEAIKKIEKPSNGSILEGTPKTLPALLRAARISEKAASVGFDWESHNDVVAKIEEELKEIEGAVGDPKALEHEIGDLMFAVVNLARHFDVDPERALKKATGRFEKRFNYIERSLSEEKKDISKTPLAEMETLWQEAKNKGL